MCSTKLESILNKGTSECWFPASKCLSPNHYEGRTVCGACEDYVEDAADRYLEGMLSDRERYLMRREEDVFWAYATMHTLVIGIIGIIGAFFLGFLRNGVGTNQWPTTVLHIGVVLHVALILLLLWSPSRTNLAFLLRAKMFIITPIVTVNAAVAAVLDKGRPAHVFRWIAFALFLLGSHFDLLST